MKKFRRYIGKLDTMLRQGKRSRTKPYSSRIKATRGLGNLKDPRTKPMSHRIVRAHMRQETLKEIADV